MVPTAAASTMPAVAKVEDNAARAAPSSILGVIIFQILIAARGVRGGSGRGGLPCKLSDDGDVGPRP